MEGVGVMIFEGTTHLADKKKWLSFDEESFKLTKHPKDLEMRLATSLLQGNLEDWWVLYAIKE